MGENGNNGNQSQKNGKSTAVIVIGVAALIGFGVFIVYLTGQATDPKLEAIVWSRLTYLLTGVEAIAFSAAGYFFGKEVNRQRAENAEANVEDAREEINQANADAVEKRTRLETISKAVINSQQKLGVGLLSDREEGSERDERDIILSNLTDLAQQMLDK